MRLFKVDPQERLITPTIHQGRRLHYEMRTLMQSKKEILGFVYTPEDMSQYVIKRSGNLSAQLLIDRDAPASFSSWFYKGIGSLPPLTGVGLIVGYDSELGEFCDCPIGLDQVQFAVEWW